MEPIFGIIVVGGAIQQIRKISKNNKANKISSRAIERATEAELKFEQHQADAMAALNNLAIRLNGIINYLQGPYFSLFDPFETSDGRLRNDLLEDLLNLNAAHSLPALQQIQRQRYRFLSPLQS